MAGVKKISISDFKTHSGTVFPSIELYYQQFGRRIGSAPIVLVNHSLTGNAQLTGKKGWWNEIIGPGKIIDTKRYTVLGFNIPGNGVMGQTFDSPVHFHTGDIAMLFLKALNVLNVKHLHALIGGGLLEVVLLGKCQQFLQNCVNI